MLLRGIVLGLAFLQMSAVVAVGAEDIVKTRQQARETKGMQTLLEHLVKTRANLDYVWIDASQSPTRCEEIEHYLRHTCKKRCFVNELALIVESHDSKLQPTRVYRVRYEDKHGKDHSDDFIMQQHGAEWRVKAHMPPVDLPKPPPKPAPSAAPAVSIP